MALFEDVEHLRRGNLRQTDGGDVAHIAAKGFVHLFVDALRFHRHVIEVRFAQERAFTLLALGDPLFAAR
ncbi:hypothetical protein D3C72_2331370 [compost metagenome]